MATLRPGLMFLCTVAMGLNVALFFAVGRQTRRNVDSIAVEAPVVVMVDSTDPDALDVLNAPPETVPRLVVRVHGPYPDAAAGSGGADAGGDKLTDAAYQELAETFDRIPSNGAGKVPVLGPHTTAQTAFVARYLRERPKTRLKFYATTSSAPDVVLRVDGVETTPVTFVVGDNAGQAKGVLSQIATARAPVVVTPDAAYTQRMVARGDNVAFLQEIIGSVQREAPPAVRRCEVPDPRGIRRAGCLDDTTDAIVLLLPEREATAILLTVRPLDDGDPPRVVLAPDSWNSPRICEVARQQKVDLRVMSSTVAGSGPDQSVSYATRATKAAFRYASTGAPVPDRSSLTWEIAPCN